MRPSADHGSRDQVTFLRHLAAHGWRPNCLFVGRGTITPALVRTVAAIGAAPVTRCLLPGPLRLPDQEHGTLVLFDAAAMRLDQQIALSDWLGHRRDVQVMTFSSTDVFEMAKQGRFLEGLYYRLNTIRIGVATAA